MGARVVARGRSATPAIVTARYCPNMKTRPPAHAPRSRSPRPPRSEAPGRSREGLSRPWREPSSPATESTVGNPPPRARRRGAGAPGRSRNRVAVHTPCLLAAYGNRKGPRRFRRRPLKLLGNYWWSRTESNRRPLQCHCSALPTELRPHGMGGRARARRRRRRPEN